MKGKLQISIGGKTKLQKIIGMFTAMFHNGMIFAGTPVCLIIATYDYSANLPC